MQKQHIAHRNGFLALQNQFLTSFLSSKLPPGLGLWMLNTLCMVHWYILKTLNSTHTRLHMSPCSFKGTCYKYNNKKHLYPLLNAQRQHKTHKKTLATCVCVCLSTVNTATRQEPLGPKIVPRRASNRSSGARALPATAATQLQQLQPF